MERDQLEKALVFVLCVCIFFSFVALLHSVTMLSDHHVHKLRPKFTLVTDATTKTPTKGNSDEPLVTASATGNSRVHTFYYNWYHVPGKRATAPQFPDQYFHWNHEYIGDKQGRVHSPPADIGSNYYPSIGLYSSMDLETIKLHCQMMVRAGLGVVVLSWYPENTSDQKREWRGFQHASVQMILDEAARVGLRVAFHIEPYKGRSAITISKDLQKLTGLYGKHPALYRYQGKRGPLPLVYIYDSYLIPAQAFSRDLASRVGSEWDTYLIGLVVESSHTTFMKQGKFDGFYTYFASIGFVYGSTPRNWASLSAFAKENEMIFIPCVGPGYIDVRVREWNSKNTKSRRDGAYYDSMWSEALKHDPQIVGVTSFNEWHEGTQIEPAREAQDPYMSYGSLGEYYYLDKTKEWSDQLGK